MRWLFAALLILVAAIAAQGELITHSVGGGSIAGGSTVIVGTCSDTQVLFDNAGKLGCDAGLTKVAGAAGQVSTGGPLFVTGNLTVTNTSLVGWGGRGGLFGPADGTIQITNNAGSSRINLAALGGNPGSLGINGGFLSSGTQPTITGTCVVVAGTRVGGAVAGSFAIPAGNCIAGTTVILSMPTATNAWACDAHDITTVGAVFNQTATAAASTTFTIATATANAADVVTWKCMGY
jgi:hypothetical protein